MKRFAEMWVLVLAATVLAAPPAIAQAPAQTPGAQQEAAAPSVGRILYVPPSRGAPSGRIGGSTRGPAPGLPSLEVLAPDHAGLTAVAQPTLFWYLGAPVRAPVQITIDTVEMTGRPPLLELELKRPPQPGINALDLAAHKVRLQQGRLYRWSVALLVDADQRSGDLLASGLIAYEPLSGGGAGAGSDPAGAAGQLAGRGYWYDAMAVLSRGIARESGQGALRAMRADLLEQVGLKEAAAFDRSGRTN